MDRKSYIMQFVKGELMHGRGTSINEDTDLLSAGIIDSLGVLQLVSFVDETFGIQIPDEDVVIENFKSVNTLAAYLESIK